jgi:hypothetical protein
MRVPIPAESLKPGKPVALKVRKAEDNISFKDCVLILEGIGTVGWARTTDLRIHNPAL